MSEHAGMIGPIKAVRMLLDGSGSLVRAARWSELQAQHEPISERYACQSCGRRDGLDAVVTDDIWERIRDGLNLLCLWCIDQRCAEAGIETTASLHFAGLAITGTTQSAADQEHISRVCDQRAALEAAARAEAEVKALRMKVEGQDLLLRAYRLSTRPPEKAFTLLRKADAALAAASASADAGEGESNA